MPYIFKLNTPWGNKGDKVPDSLYNLKQLKDFPDLFEWQDNVNDMTETLMACISIIFKDQPLSNEINQKLKNFISSLSLLMIQNGMTQEKIRRFSSTWLL